jgi:hypothetical protein
VAPAVVALVGAAGLRDRSRTASTINNTTPATLAAIHIQAITALPVTTAVTRAASPMTARTSAMISIDQRRPVSCCRG